MEEWKKQRALVWKRLQTMVSAGPFEKYHLKDVFLKLRFHKYDANPNGDILLHSDQAIPVPQASPRPSLSQNSL